MTCPECKARNKTSTVYMRNSSRTDKGFVPSAVGPGGAHLHDPNIITEQFECTLGHRFRVERRVACPRCDYGHEEPEVTLLTHRRKFVPGVSE